MIEQKTTFTTFNGFFGILRELPLRRKIMGPTRIGFACLRMHKTVRIAFAGRAVPPSYLEPLPGTNFSRLVKLNKSSAFQHKTGVSIQNCRFRMLEVKTGVSDSLE